MTRVVPCAGGIVFDGRGRLLLIQRGNPPAAGSWSVPGGRCHAGESAEDACVREVAEETGQLVTVLHRVGNVRRDAPNGDVYDIDDFVCALVDGAGVDGTVVTRSVVAGDDAVDARWVTRADLENLPLAPLLFETLFEWDCLPRC